MGERAGIFVARKPKGVRASVRIAKGYEQKTEVGYQRPTEWLWLQAYWDSPSVVPTR